MRRKVIVFPLKFVILPSGKTIIIVEMKNFISIRICLCLIVGMFLLNSCETETSEVYVFGITNSMSLDNSDRLDVMNYVSSRMSFEAIQVTVCDCDEAEGVAQAKQIFESRLSAIDDDELNAKLHGDDFYSISLIMAATSSDGVETEITSKKWPTK